MSKKSPWCLKPVALAAIALLAAPPIRGQASSPSRPPSLATLEAAAQRDSLDADALFQLAVAYDLAKRYDDAERVARQAVAVDPRDAQAWLLLASLPYDRRSKLWKEVRRDQVPPEWRQAVEESDRFEHRAFLLDPLVDFRVRGTPPPKEDVLEIRDYGQETTDYLLELGLGAFGWRYLLSYSALDLYAERQYKGQAVDSIPSGLLWWRGLAAAHVNAHRHAIADIQLLLNRALKHEASDSLIQITLGTEDFQYLLGLLQERAGHTADAITFYQAALATNIGLYMAHVRLARLYASHKMWDAAIEEAQRAETANPDDPTTLLDLAAILRDAGHTADAQDALRRAQAANPRNPRVPYELGLVELQLGQSAEAKTAFTRFLAIAPSRMGSEINDAKQRLAGLP
ncbi:MAG TPA: tetratricopeptide repeat protein [Candidatus Acidoferrum sp.]|nr:tetratricopeptide repeat protein [Candidatus Acidoferrum sp.]